MQDSEKVIEIMRYMNYSCYHWENMLRVAENNLMINPCGDPYAVLEYYRAKCHKEMFDRVFADLSKILYGFK